MDAEKATVDSSKKEMLNKLNSEENQKRNSTYRDVFSLIIGAAYVGIGASVSETLIKIRFLVLSKIGKLFIRFLLLKTSLPV